MKIRSVLITALILFLFSNMAVANDWVVKDTKFYNDENRNHYILKGTIVSPENSKFELTPDFKIKEEDGLSSIFISPVFDKKYKVTGYDIYAKKRSSSQGKSTLKFFDSKTDKEINLKWNYINPDQGKADIIALWARNRIDRFWSHYDRGNGKNIISYWIDIEGQYYSGLSSKNPSYYYNYKKSMQLGGRLRKSASVTDIFGGRAAIEETLQLQPITQQRRKKTKSDEIMIPIDEIKGVKVKAYPFKNENLKKNKKLSLADYSPADRFFVSVFDPAAFLDLMENGGKKVFDSLSLFSGRNIEYRLYEKYLKKLGLKKDYVKKIIGNGMVKKFSIICPDFFIADGTEITIVAEINSLDSFFSKLFNLFKYSKSKPKRIKTEYAGYAYRYIKDKHLILSTSKKEIEKVLNVIEKKEKSLGDLNEFKYISSKLSTEDTTKYFLFFSDPFIRRLVSPQLKISQLRRLKAKSEMEMATAAALLYKADGHDKKPEIQTLINKKYLPDSFADKFLYIDDNGICYSKDYGSLQNLKSVLEKKIESATKTEAYAYKTYLNNYNRYWSDYFDPIGLKINKENDKNYKVSTYILPLVDNSIYRSLKGILSSNVNEKLKIPEVLPKPASILSLNIDKKNKNSIYRIFERLLPYELLSIIKSNSDSGIHISFPDTDPLIELGTGGLAGSGGGSAFMGRGMVFIPVLITTLTRPVNIMIGLKDEKKAFENLKRVERNYYLEGNKIFEMGTKSFYKIEGKNEWLWNLSVEGLINMNFNVKIENGFLIISNMPFTNKVNVKKSDKKTLTSAGLNMYPSSIDKQLKSIFSSKLKKERESAFFGAGSLFPIKMAYPEDINKLKNRHYKLFGFVPTHPKRGKWIIEDAIIKSSVFKKPYLNIEPEFDEKKDHNFLKDINNIFFNMELEGDNLKADISWSFE